MLEPQSLRRGRSRSVFLKLKNHGKLTRFFKEYPCYDLKQKFAFHLRTVFVPPYALHGSSHHNGLVFSVFEGFFFKAASGPPFPENISNIFCTARSGWMQKSIATFWPPFRPQRLRRPVIFRNHLLITVWQGYRIEGKIALPMTSLKIFWAISFSLFFVLRKFSIKCVANGCTMQKRCDKLAKFGLQVAVSQHLWV